MSQRKLGVIVTIVALVAVAISTLVGEQQLSYQRCVNRVTNQLIIAQRERATFTDARDEAWDKFVDTSLNATTDVQKKQALDDWLKARRELNDARKTHPLPGPPSERC